MNTYTEDSDTELTLNPEFSSPAITEPPPSQSSNEVPFSFDELFFSRTDEKGIILSGNSVFQRVSIYAWDELLNKPHKIIRHPDMPKAVFWLLWDTIKSGHPVGAYVKNRAKDGRHYWVFAIVTPIDGGFLSVRLKPSSSLFRTVKNEYIALRKIENSDHPTPEKSAKILLSRLQNLGYRDYNAFMASALSHEIIARDRQLKKPEDPSVANFNKLVESAQHLLDHTKQIFSAYEGHRHVPLNLRVHAAQLGETGAAIGVISSNYTTIAAELQDKMTQFMESGTHVAQTIDNGLFLASTARIQGEVASIFKQEAPNKGASQEKEMINLEQQQQAYSHKAAQGLKEISVKISQFKETCLEMRKLTASLEVTRVMGKIQCASLDASNSSLPNLINDLGQFQDAIADGLKLIDQANKAIEYNIDYILECS
ncbi:PAS domain-containing protein [Kiloniella majae]|uniref:PAS domain-containing protein n=1 Tax=Kiloniella majae TaxID=1938558 RepID=UPI000A2791B3|nr:PAS domain-containing protein [Kiloniella majae]